MISDDPLQWMRELVLNEQEQVKREEARLKAKRHSLREVQNFLRRLRAGRTCWYSVHDRRVTLKVGELYLVRRVYLRSERSSSLPSVGRWWGSWTDEYGHIPEVTATDADLQVLLPEMKEKK